MSIQSSRLSSKYLIMRLITRFAAACLMAVISTVDHGTFAVAQSFQGSSVVYIPEAARAIIFGGFSGSATLDSIGSISFASSFDVDSPPFTRITPGLPNAAHSLAPVVRQSSGNSDLWDIALFGGATVNTTNPSGSPVPLSSAISLSSSASSNRVFGIRDTPVPASVTGGDFVNSCTSLSATARTIAGAVEPNSGFAFGGYSRRENTTLDSVFILGSDNLLKQVTPPTNANRAPTPPARASGSLIRFNATHLILTGGINSAGSGLRDVWLYDLRSTAWSQYPSALSSVRAKHQAVVHRGGNGRDYVILVGGDRSTSIIEYANVAANQAWFTASVQGMEVMSTMVNHAVVVIDEQLVLFGASMNQNDPSNFLPVSVIKIKTESDNTLSFSWMSSFQRLRSNTPEPSPAVPEPFTNGDADGSTSSSIIGVGIGLASVAFIISGVTVHDRRRFPPARTSHSPGAEPAGGFCQVPMSDIAPSESASQVGHGGTAGAAAASSSQPVTGTWQARALPHTARPFPSVPQPTAGAMIAGGSDVTHEVLYLMDKVPLGAVVAPGGSDR